MRRLGAAGVTVKHVSHDNLAAFGALRSVWIDLQAVTAQPSVVRPAEHLGIAGCAVSP